MGCSISGILAILFMDRLERIALRSEWSLLPYKRYVDDIYIKAENEQAANNFHRHMNSLHSKIKFEIEKPTPSPHGHTLSLLDLTVTITHGRTCSFEFYQKPAKKPLFVHRQSALSMNNKMNIIQNERNRIVKRCSSSTTSLKHIKNFEDVLRQYGYNNNDINTSLKKPNCNDKSKTTDWQYLKIPFISKQNDRKISKIFRNKNLKVRLTHRSHSLRHALGTPKANPQSKRQQCPLAHTGNCFKRNCIYQILCTKCNDFYIGSTIRHLHDRIKEHFENSNSSIKN